jgi:hypothetical protein
MLRALITVLSALAALTVADANAQTKYPTKPVDLIVRSSPAPPPIPAPA